MAENKVEIEDLGDGLFRQGGDIYCNYPLISVERKDNANKGACIFDFDKYIVTVTYDIEGDVRKNPHWKREYKKQESGADG